MTTALPFTRVKLKPVFLRTMIPIEWFNVAEALCQIQADYKVSDADMSLYVSVGNQMNVPLVPAVEAMAKGDITLQMEEAKPESNLILPAERKSNA